MMDATEPNANRPSKRDASEIDNDKSASEQPIVKRGKGGAESVPSSEVVKLQQKVSLLEDNSQIARRAARDAQSRAESLEKLLESERMKGDDEKKQIVMEMEKKLAEILRQREEARKCVKSANDAKIELSHENEALNTELAETRRARSELARENEALKNEMAQMKKEHNDKMANLITRSSDKQAMDRERIDDLTKKLAEYEEETVALLRQLGLPTTLQPMERTGDDAAKITPSGNEKELDLHDTGHPTNIVQLRLPDVDLLHTENQQSAASGVVARPITKLAAAVPDATHTPLSQSDLKLHEFGHPTNILQMCRPDASDMTPYKSARAGILSAIKQYEGKTLHLKLSQCFWRGEAQLRDLIHWCSACKKELRYLSIIQHFLSSGHQQKAVREHGAAVSGIALRFWIDKIKQENLVFGGPAAVIKNAGDLQRICHPTNILQLCHPDSKKSMSIGAARSMIFSIPLEVKERRHDQLCERFEKLSQQESDILCRACGETIQAKRIMQHFLSKLHTKQVSCLGANVSRAAIEYWAEKLQQPAADAADPKLVAASKEIEMEEVDE